MDSILNSVKMDIGLPSVEYEHFDNPLITAINTAISIATQLGVGPSTGYEITGSTEKWSDWLADESLIKMVRSYISAQVKLMFDPPQSAAAIEVINQRIKMLEFRLNAQVDKGEDYAWKNSNSLSE